MKYIFPFWEFDKGDNVILYGAGEVGKDYYSYNSLLNWIRIPLWLDMYKKQACGVLLTYPLTEYVMTEFDFILIALADKEQADEAKQYLIEQCGVSERGIIWVDPNSSLAEGMFLDWYYDEYVTNKHFDYIVRVRFVDFLSEMILETVKLLPNVRFTCSYIDDARSLLLYGHICARESRYPVMINYEDVRVAFWYGEADVPDMSYFDYAFTARKLDDSKCYYVNYFFPEDEFLRKKNIINANGGDVLFNRKFCNFIYSNDSFGEGARLRKDFCLRLRGYKDVDCPGRVLNNMRNAITPRDGDWSRGKREFIKKYKFTIAFENTRAKGYTTEKLWDPLLVGSIPIYWGNPEIGEYVNKDCMIDCRDFDDDFSAVIERVKEIDQDEEKYKYMLSVSPLKDKRLFGWKKEFKENFCRLIVENDCFTDCI